MALPYELVDEILYRVPVKHLLRCRCVSKRWCSVIDSNEFVKKHYEASVERNRGGIIISGNKKLLLADFESINYGNAAINLSREMKRILDGARLVGSANALFCLCKEDNFFLLNPCTRKCKTLPMVPTKFLSNRNVCGFGYDRVSDDYKVVITTYRNLPTRGIIPVVYSLRKNKWSPIPNVFSMENINFIGIRGQFADGALHWKATDVTFKSSMVVSFDLSLEQFRETKYYNGTNIVLMDISMESSWVEEISANLVFASFRSPRYLMHLKSLKKTLFEVDNKRLVWYDFRSKSIKNVSIPGIPYLFVSDMYIESLFPLIEDKQPLCEAKGQPSCEAKEQPSCEAKEKKQRQKENSCTIL